MKRVVVALAVGLCVLSSAQAANAQSSRELLDREDPRFCAQADVWTRATGLVKDLLPTWKFTAAQRDAIEVGFSGQTFDLAHPDRVQVICSATITLTGAGESRSLRTRFDAVPQGPTGFRLEATNASDLLRFLMDLKTQ
ncbi:hypothetical protein [Brevundimonas sp.]|uniref:hypothetical protein n=1 Tax=Brevundimonas sp. TaxID=1871086 RepID=UPI002FCAB41B